MINVILTLLALTFNLVSAGITPTKYSDLCFTLNYDVQQLADLNTIGDYGDKCICKNKYNPTLQYTCTKGNYTLPKNFNNYNAYYAPDKTGNWHCLKAPTCNTLCSALKDKEAFESYDYDKIGTLGNTCYCPNKDESNRPLLCDKGNAALPTTADNNDDYYAPTLTGNWNCLKTVPISYDSTTGFYWYGEAEKYFRYDPLGIKIYFS